MSDLLKALDEVNLELDSLSDEQLQAQFEASKGGAVAAIMNEHQFLDPDAAKVVLANANVTLVVTQ
ncbi:hypothetical protein D3C87_616450 [compost metagenome]